MISKEVPRFTKYLDVWDEEFLTHADGIVSLAMVMGCHSSGIRKYIIDKLINEGILRGYYNPEHGWAKEGIIDLAGLFGFVGKRFDFSAVANGGSMKAMAKIVVQTPVIAVIHRGFNKSNNRRFVVVKEIKGEKNQRMIFFNDPNATRRDEVAQQIPFDTFSNGWLKEFLAVVPKKNKKILEITNQAA